MKWLLIAIFCVSSASAALVGSNRCTWGPAYWCQGIETAKKCGAVPHCASKVWGKSVKSDVASTETCLMCKGIVQDLKTLVADKKTQAEIKNLALKACNLMKNEKTAYEVCNTVVIMFLPEVIQMIQSELDAGKICSLLHLCQQSKLAGKFERVAKIIKMVKTMKTSSDCDECKLAVTMVKSYVSENSTQQEIMQFIDEEICSRLSGSPQTVCKSIVAQVMPEVFKSLNEILDPDTICEIFGLCPKKANKFLLQNLVKQLVKNKKFRANPVECDLCKSGITDIRNTLRDAATQKEIEDFLKNEVCTHFGSLEITCQQGVTQYFPLVIKLLVTELDPDTVCKAIGLCSSSTVHRIPAMKMTRAKVTLMQQPKASPQCVLCEFLMSKLDSMLAKNSTEQEIVDALEKVCSILPQTVRKECDSFVAEYGPMIVKLLVADLSPSMVCTALGLCAGEKEPMVILTKWDSSCNLMVRYMHVLAKELHLSLEVIVEKVCNFLPRNERHTCRVFIRENKHKILKMKKSDFVVKFHPDRLCKRIRAPLRRNGLVHLLGRDKCTYGPAFWCANHENARKCNAVEHCMTRVWKRSGSLL